MNLFNNPVLILLDTRTTDPDVVLIAAYSPTIALDQLGSLLTHNGRSKRNRLAIRVIDRVLDGQRDVFIVPLAI